MKHTQLAAQTHASLQVGGLVCMYVDSGESSPINPNLNPLSSSHKVPLKHTAACCDTKSCRTDATVTESAWVSLHVWGQLSSESTHPGEAVEGQLHSPRLLLHQCRQPCAHVQSNLDIWNTL